MSKLIGLLFLIGWVAGQLLRLPGEFPVTVLDVAVGIAAIGSLAKICLFAVTLLRRLADQGWPQAAASSLRKFANFANSQKISLWITVILIFSWLIGLRLFSWQESIPGGLYLLRFLAYLLVIVNAEKFLGPVKKYITPAFWIFIILAWVQYLFLPDTRFLLQYGWDEHYYRMIGTVLDPNYLGVMMGVIAIYAVEKEKKIKKQKDVEKFWKRSNVWLAALALSGLAVTYSRASWVALMVVGCWLLVVGGGLKNKLGRLRGLGILFLILIVWIIAPKPGGEGVNLLRISSIEQRLASWNHAIELWKQHPWFGVGFNQFGSKLPSSSWLTILQSMGVVGLMILGTLGILVIRKVGGKSFWVVVAIMLGIHAVFNNTLFYPPVLGLLALIKAASED